MQGLIYIYLTIKSVHRCSYDVPNLNFLYRFSKKENTHIPNFMKIRLVGAELYHARRTDRYDEATNLKVALPICERDQLIGRIGRGKFPSKNTTIIWLK